MREVVQRRAYADGWRKWRGHPRPLPVFGRGCGSPVLSTSEGRRKLVPRAQQLRAQRVAYACRMVQAARRDYIGEIWQTWGGPNGTDGR